MGDELHPLEHRISELNRKASQLLTALSFAIAAAILLKQYMCTPFQNAMLRWSLRLWVISLFPVLVMILAVKEFRVPSTLWYRTVRRLKVLLLWIAVGLIFFGALAFLLAVWSLA